MGVVPIVNENDTIAVAEIKFGDNDTLSAITAAMVHADYLFLMTDVDCLYDRNPRTYPDAKAIEVVENIDQLQADVTSKGSSVGTGGMATKIIAARLATSAGVATIITRSSNPGNVVSIVRYLQYLRSQNPDSQSNTPPRNGNGANGAANDKQHDACGDAEGLVQAVSSMRIDPATVPKHTRFLPVNPPIRDRYMWLLHCLSPSGTIYIDSGAHRALLNKNGLLPVGILGVDGTFAQQEAVRLVVVAHSYPNQLSYNGGIEVGRALVNYSSTEIGRIKGLRSNKIMEVLGYAETEYVAFRENISFFKRESRPATPSAPPTPRIEVGALEY
jgi:glutamate 5-kinase